MKNFNILGVHWKIGLLGGKEEGSSKNNIEGGLPKKRGLGQCRFKGRRLARKRRWCFLGGKCWYPNSHYGLFDGGGIDTPVHTMDYFCRRYQSY